MAFTSILALLGHRITYFVLMGIGGLVGSLFFYLDNEVRTMRTTYQQTSCKVVHSEVTLEEHVSRGRYGSRQVHRTFYPDIVYQYTVNGEEFECDAYRAFEMGMTEEEATKVVGRYAEDRPATCYYDPANPEEAVLTLDADRSLMETTAVTGLLLLFAGLAGWIVIDFVLPRADRAAKPPQQDLTLQIPEWSSIPRTSYQGVTPDEGGSGVSSGR